MNYLTQRLSYYFFSSRIFTVIYNVSVAVSVALASICASLPSLFPVAHKFVFFALVTFNAVGSAEPWLLVQFIINNNNNSNTNSNRWLLVHKKTILTEVLPLLIEVNANFCGKRSVM
jgi:hypothetical protein